MEIIGGTTMEGWFFYYSFWTVWIILSFIVPKPHPYRLPYSVFVLISLILSTKTVTLFGLQMNATVFFWYGWCMVLLSRLKLSHLLYQVCASLVSMLVYTVFLLFELYDPIWVIMDRRWLLTILISVVTILLNSSIEKRLIVSLIGLIMGEILNAVVLRQTGIDVTITSPGLLDICSIICITVIGWSSLENLLKSFHKKYIPKPHIEKEKQKLG